EGENLLIEEEGATETISVKGKNPLDLIRELMSPLTLQSKDNSLPGLLGGAVGYIGYDFIRWIETLPKTLKDPIDLPTLNLFLTGSLVIF
ncbi:MAG: hypothetical protein QF645_07645, partial [Planctomycetota bacterium]|nr:hypothetical protein [Planctomycetota bacterium]